MVDPHDTNGLREAMLRLIEDDDEARQRAELGLAQAARFTWQACAEKTLAVYRQAIAAAENR
jgi:glycosyltransferase involved in cell wall biosynthesis